jgi:mevalonate kinase
MAPANSRSSTGPGSFADDEDAAPGRRGVGRAHGKAILLGEHAVVYGAPAMAIPVPQLTVTATATRLACPGGGADTVSFVMAGPRSASVTQRGTGGLQRLVADFKRTAGVTGRVCVDVLIDCRIPLGRGLGSSAACARAAVLALADLFDRRLDDRAVFALVQASEKVAHGRASGIDALATGATSAILFRSGTARELTVPMAEGRTSHSPGAAGGHAGTRRPVGFDGLFVIADSGVSGSTRDAVEMLRRKFERAPETRTEFVGRVSRLTDAAARDFAYGRAAEFGARLTENHGLLRGVGISTDRIDALVDAALAAGSLGAKISGGGLGGCMIALAGDDRQAQAVVRRLRQAGAVRTWVVPAERFAGHVD